MRMTSFPWGNLEEFVELVLHLREYEKVHNTNNIFKCGQGYIICW